MYSMRSACASVALLGLLAAAATAQAGVLVLKDGRAIRTTGPIEIRGETAVFTLEDGTAVSVRSESVDFAATDRAREILAGEPRPGAAGSDGERAPSAPKGRTPTQIEALPER